MDTASQSLKTKRPLVSVIMPAYNASTFIQEAIKSVIAQSWLDWELIVVDDGSIDQTATLVNAILVQDKRVRYFFQTNGGQAKARNTGIKNARGNHIAFLDADDYWLPAHLSSQLILMEEKEADLVFSHSQVINEEGDLQSELLGGHMNKLLNQEFTRQLIAGNFIPILSVVCKRDIFENGLWFNEDEKLRNVEDFELWIRVLAKGHIFYGNPMITAHYRRHSQSQTAKDIACTLPLVFMYLQLINHLQGYQSFLENCFKEKWIQLERRHQNGLLEIGIRMLFSKVAFHSSRLWIWLFKRIVFFKGA